jgi:hypothetical protein
VRMDGSLIVTTALVKGSALALFRLQLTLCPLRWPRSFGQSSGLVKLIPGYLMPPVWSSPGPR